MGYRHNYIGHRQSTRRRLTEVDQIHVSLVHSVLQFTGSKLFRARDKFWNMSKVGNNGD